MWKGNDFIAKDGCNSSHPTKNKAGLVKFAFQRNWPKVRSLNVPCLLVIYHAHEPWQCVAENCAPAYLSPFRTKAYEVTPRVELPGLPSLCKRKLVISLTHCVVHLALRLKPDNKEKQSYGTKQGATNMGSSLLVSTPQTSGKCIV